MKRIVLAALLAVTATPAFAAPPVAAKSCIGNRDIRAKRLSAETGYYVQTSRGWWRNTVSCPAFGADRALLTHSYNDQQCSGDVVEAIDTFSRINYGGCALGNWEKVDGPPAAPTK